MAKENSSPPYLCSSFQPADTITAVMTVKDISTKLNKKTKLGERLQFASILKGYVMDINTESISPGIISNRWFISLAIPLIKVDV